jgi:Amidohydrolase
MLLAEMDGAGVSRVVIVPPSWEGDRNDLALEAARLHPRRFAVMGRLAIERPESRALVADWRKQPGMLGMRFTFHTDEQRPWLTDGTADWLWPAAERAGIPLMVLVPGSLDALQGIAERHPALKLTIDHVGLNRAAKGSQPIRRSPEGLRAREAAQRGRESFGHAVPVGRELSVPRSPRADPPARRGVRSSADVLGNGSHANAVHVSRVRQPVHRGIALARRRRPRVGHGSRRVRLARLAAAGFVSSGSETAWP